MRQVRLAIVLAMCVAFAGCAISTTQLSGADHVVDAREIEEQASALIPFLHGQTNVQPAFNQADGSTVAMPDLLLSMRERWRELDPLMVDGCIGTDNRGYLSVRDCPTLATAEAKNTAQRLAATENEDRKKLYLEIARRNEKNNVTLSAVERVYAWEFLKLAVPGECYQLPGEGEHYNRFAQSPLGKRLGPACQPGVWAIIPQ